MKSWTTPAAWELCCEAALLPDKEAIAFLCKHIDTYASNTDNYGLLLSALAWLDAERALKYYDDSIEGVRHVFPRSYLEAYQEALWLHSCTEEQRAAYRALTTLLPDGEPATQKRQQALGFLCARQLPLQFIGSPNWERCANYFLFSRLCLEFPEHLQDWSQERTARARYWGLGFLAMEQTLVRLRQEEGYIQRLVGLVEKRCLSKQPMGDDMDAKAFYATLCVLERHAPDEVRRLERSIVRVACSGTGYTAAAMTAYIFILITRLDLNSNLLCIIRDKFQSISHYRMGRPWLKQVERFLHELTSEPEAALRLARIIHVYIIARRIEQLISQEPKKAVTQKRRQRALRWLARSQRIIDSVEFPFWQEQLRAKKVRLEARVRESQRPAHMAILAQEGE